MTEEEKLENFSKTVLADVNAKNEAVLSEYQHGLSETVEEQRRIAQEKAENNYKYEKDVLERKKNKTLADVLLSEKKKVSEQSTKIGIEVFSLLKTKVEEFKESEEYVDYLIRSVEKMKAFAKNEEMVVYIDPSDEKVKDKVEKATRVTLTISDTEFVGGIKAMIEAKNILIDNSLMSKIAEAKSHFKV